jgi:hypothetical protein
MNNSGIRAVVTILVTILFASAVAWAGSQGGYSVFGIPYLLCASR